MRIKELLTEKWTAKYKRSINCSNPKGFSQKAHCQGRKKNNEGIDIGKEWMSDTELDDFIPSALQDEWRELVGYNEEGDAHPLWVNMTGDYEPNSLIPQHRKWMIEVANKWVAMKRIPNVQFYGVRDIGDELEWLVQIGPSEQQLQERRKKRKVKYAAYGPGPYGLYGYDAGYSGSSAGTGVEEDASDTSTVTRIDSKPIKDFATNLKAYKHTDDWSQSGVDTGDDSYWEKKNLKVNTTKGLYAGDPHRTALYATGNAHETRYVEFKLDGQPIVYFDKKDLPKIRSRKTYLTVFDASNFKKLPTGEYFSENPGEPLEQTVIKDPFQYIADQGWIVRITDDLEKVFKQVQAMHKSGKISQYGAEGMNENMRLHEFAPAGSGNSNPPRGPKTPGKDPWGDNDPGEDPYSKPVPEYYSRSIDFFGRFEADHFDDEEFNERTGEFKGYWDDEEGRIQIAYFKFDNPSKTGSDDPGMGWYYEPQNESLAENFADGRNPQDKGDSKRHGVPTKASISTLRKVAKQGGRKGQLAHWMANMKAGKAKKK